MQGRNLKSATAVAGNNSGRGGSANRAAAITDIDVVIAGKRSDAE
jgi:hypothetical protein